ncbi:MAG: ATPase [Alphaproteobacteria bacterium]|nr:ATPase [Alphaproteobacteria bacterium]
MKKSVTLMGMSGAGKTELSWRLAKWGWYHYNCDYLIGTKYLRDELGDAVKKDDLGPLSKYVGQVGKGALPLQEFRRRQKRYIEAERAALLDMCADIESFGGKLVNDSTGSLCEIEDESVFEKLAQHTLFVYLKSGPEQEEALLARAVADPKPLYFPAAKFDGWLAEYMQQTGAAAVEDIEPDDFSRWVFPKLFHSRLPKYQRLADQYGVTVPSAALWEVESEEKFLEVVTKVLDEQNR